MKPNDYIRVISVYHKVDMFETKKYFGHFVKRDEFYLYLQMTDKIRKIPLKSIKEIKQATKRKTNIDKTQQLLYNKNKKEQLK